MQRFSLHERTLRCAGSLHVVPHQFIWIEFRCVARQEMKFQFPPRRCDVVLHYFRLVGRQAVKNQEQRLPATTHQDLEHPDEQLGTHSAFVGHEPKASSGIDCRSRRDGLSLAWHGNNRTLASCTPRCPLHRIGTESGFIPEVDFRTDAFCPFCNAWIDVAFPSFNRSRITLVGSFQRFLRRQTQLRQKLADSGHAQIDPKLLPDELAHYQPRPQAKIKTMLAWVLPVDPTKKLLFLLQREAARSTRAFS